MKPDLLIGLYDTIQYIIIHSKNCELLTFKTSYNPLLASILQSNKYLKEIFRTQKSSKI